MQCKEKHSFINSGLLMNLRESKSAWPEDNKKPYPFKQSLHYNCRSDLGSIRIHRVGEVPTIPTSLEHKKSFSFVVTPKIIESDQAIRRFPPHA